MNDPGGKPVQQSDPDTMNTMSYPKNTLFPLMKPTPGREMPEVRDAARSKTALRALFTRDAC